jgi:hypothetical protein
MPDIPEPAPYALPCPDHAAHSTTYGRATCAACAAMPVQSHEQHLADYRASCVASCALLEAARARMKERGITIASVARSVHKSPSFIGTCLKGNYPYRNAGGLPRYLLQYLRSCNLLLTSEEPAPCTEERPP